MFFANNISFPTFFRGYANVLYPDYATTAIHLPELNMLVTSAADRTFRFWSTAQSNDSVSDDVAPASSTRGGEVQATVQTALSVLPYLTETQVEFYNKSPWASVY